eukprot:UN02348
MDYVYYLLYGLSFYIMALLQVLQIIFICNNRAAYEAILYNNNHWYSGLWRNGFNAVEILFAVTGFLLARPFFMKTFSSSSTTTTTTT